MKHKAPVWFGFLLIMLAVGVSAWFAHSLVERLVGVPTATATAVAVGAVIQKSTKSSANTQELQAIPNRLLLSKNFATAAPLAVAASAASPIQPTAKLAQKPANTASEPMIPLASGMAVRPLISGGVSSTLKVDAMWEVVSKTPLPPSPTPVSAPDWKIVGLFQRANQTSVMVQIEGQTDVQYFNVGNFLPGGSQLVWVRPDVIGVKLPDRRTVELAVLDGEKSAAQARAKSPQRP